MPIPTLSAGSLDASVICDRLSLFSLPQRDSSQELPFSPLLTFWQPFIIGATCSWCLISAMTMTTCCLFNLGERRRQIDQVRDRG